MPVLWLLLLACGESAAPCEARATPAERDACHQAQATERLAADPAGALQAARSIGDPLVRELVLLEVVTSGAYAEAEVRAICQSELQSAAVRDRCTSWLQRPHLRVEAGGGGATASGAAARLPTMGGAAGGDCATAEGERADWCRYEAALAAPGPAEAEAALRGIESPDLRGQAVAGVLRQARPTRLEQVRELAPLAQLAQDRWQAEAESLLGSELPFHVLRACMADPARRPACRQEQLDRALPWGLERCGQAGPLQEQCLDHLCAGVAELALAEARGLPAEAVAPAVRAAHAAAVARAPQIDARPACAATWSGRKLVQLGGGDPAWADARCAGFGEDAAACRAGLAEELWTRRLGQFPVADADALVALALEPGDSLGPLSAELRSALPCGALAVLTGQLSPGLAHGDLSPAARDRLDAAAQAATCPWSAP